MTPLKTNGYKMKNYVIWLLALLVLLAGCGHQIHSGTVHEKMFVAAHETHTVIYVMCGKILMPLPMTHKHPDAWSVRVRGKGTAGTTYDEWFSVSKSEWENLQIGDSFVEKTKEE